MGRWNSSLWAKMIAPALTSYQSNCDVSWVSRWVYLPCARTTGVQSCGKWCLNFWLNPSIIAVGWISSLAQVESVIRLRRMGSSSSKTVRGMPRGIPHCRITNSLPFDSDWKAIDHFQIRVDRKQLLAILCWALSRNSLILTVNSMVTLSLQRLGVGGLKKKLCYLEGCAGEHDRVLLTSWRRRDWHFQLSWTRPIEREK